MLSLFLTNLTNWYEYKITHSHFAHLGHQDFEAVLGFDDACDAVYALFQAALAVCDENFLLKVSDLSVPVDIKHNIFSVYSQYLTHIITMT